MEQTGRYFSLFWMTWKSFERNVKFSGTIVISFGTLIIYFGTFMILVGTYVIFFGTHRI